jgi:hypothetical protein
MPSNRSTDALLSAQAQIEGGDQPAQLDQAIVFAQERERGDVFRARRAQRWRRRQVTRFQCVLIFYLDMNSISFGRRLERVRNAGLFFGYARLGGRKSYERELCALADYVSLMT